MARVQHSAVPEEVRIARATSRAAVRPPGPASTIYRLDVLALSRVSLAAEPSDSATLRAPEQVGDPAGQQGEPRRAERERLRVFQESPTSAPIAGQATLRTGRSTASIELA